MCRFLLYAGSPVTLSDLITEPANSLIHQSFHSEEREEPLNGDGFGLAWYVPEIGPEPGTFRAVSPAWSNRNLQHLARATRSGCVLAHIRAASEATSVSEANCHPFTFGRFAFMHNGDLAGFAQQRRSLLASLSDAAFARLEGTTDSEYIFAYFMDRYEAGHGAGAERLATALAETVQGLLARVRAAGETGPSYLNCAVSDGVHAAVSRCTTDRPDNAESLHMHTGKLYRCIDGACRLVEPEDGAGAIIVSSEQLSADPGWQMIAPNRLVVLTGAGVVENRALQLPA